MNPASAQSSTTFREFLNVGLIQTTVDAASAWPKSVGPPMHALEQARAWEEIRWCLRCFRNSHPKPHIILIPELAVPRGRIDDLQRAAMSTGTVVIAGVDYNLDHQKQTVRNEAIVIIPDRWHKSERSWKATSMVVGKTYPARTEEAALQKAGGWRFEKEPHMWVFEAGEAGRFGIAICYDFLDLQRALMYRQQIQHLFVVSYNRDVESFLHMSESLARTIYCNVVVCNTGFHGGSLVVTPYYDPWLRTVYRHNGNQMLAHQVVQLPVASLIEAQNDNAPKETFKSLPPGWDPGRMELVKRPFHLK
ncbi:MAG: hypothetical protein NW208_05375 [Bryobacter sp.]|nr:hypothetical protein [Bryobacter sp.]